VRAVTGAVVMLAAGSIVMAVDEAERWLATGDVNGVVKVWDISDYCVVDNSPIDHCPPCEFTMIASCAQ